MLENWGVQVAIIQKMCAKSRRMRRGLSTFCLAGATARVLYLGKLAVERTSGGEIALIKAPRRWGEQRDERVT